MADNKSRHNAKQALDDSAEETVENAKELSHDLVEYAKAYARDNPGTAALWCLGIGFVLGWKMKPW
jgi:ElaB/YqjD/DUF883 family membrane-anchored ribosome-binding protein